MTADRRTAPLLLAVAAAACALATPAVSSAEPRATPQLAVALDAGTTAWTTARQRTLHRVVTPAGTPGVQLRTSVDGTLVDTSSSPDVTLAFADGDHLVAVEAVAPGATTSPRVTARVKVDTVAPAVHLSVPDSVSVDDMPFTGGADASDSGSGVKSWALSVDGAPQPWGSWFSMTLAPGLHGLHAVASDVAGNTGEAFATVDVFAPAPEPVDTPAPRTSSRAPSRSGARGPSRPVYKLCLNLKRGEQCGPGKGRRTKGGPGTGMVSHKGWPAVTGVLWKVLDSGDHRRSGGPDNDELLGHHGDDRLSGLAGKDILWGDWDPENNTTRQQDVLKGGPGDDWLYPSHGRNRLSGGSGADRIIAFYGRGTIDCGPGRDVAQVRMNGAYRLKNCERVRHFTGG